jgi:methylmalonyl-CoA/ethylmalonyl-CoA epimerase
MITGIDHIAIAVKDTEVSLGIWRDLFGFKVKHSEKVNGDSVLLTHLDGGGVDIQLVEPLASDHPLHAWLAEHGPGLNHICLAAEAEKPVIQNFTENGFTVAQETTHQGIMGKWALFLDPKTTENIRVEVTGY